MAADFRTCYAGNMTRMIQWGRGAQQVLDWTKNPAGGTGPRGTGRPVIVYRHSGGGTSGDINEFYTGGGQVAYRFMDYLLGGAGNAPNAGSRAVAFDVVALESGQRTFNSTTIPRSSVSYFPDFVYEWQRAIQMVKAMCPSMGCDPNMVIASGSSWGSLMSILGCCLQPALGQGGVGIDRRTIYESRGYNSIPKALLLFDGVYDFRKLMLSNGITFSGATWNDGTKQITSVGAFTHYRYFAGDQARMVSGNNTTLGLFDITSKVSNDVIQLATSIGAAAFNVGGYVPTDQLDLAVAMALFGHSPVVGDGSAGNNTTWDSIPAALRGAASPRQWAESRRLSYLPPVYLQSTIAGLGLTPYGSTWRGGLSNVHDNKQSQDLAAAIVAAGKSALFNFTLRDDANPANAWNGSHNDLANTSFPDSKRLYDWIAARILDP